jgi:transposase
MTTMAAPSTMVQHHQGPGPDTAGPVREVTGGVDTHKDTHTAAAVDGTGALLGTAQFRADPAGYVALLDWLHSLGTVVLVGVEGTGCYGLGLARHLRSADIATVEIDRPDRKSRHRHGKSDPVDAEAAARAALARTSTGAPKHHEGQVEALRALRVARRGAIRHRSDLQRQIKALIITAPEPLRTALRDLPVTQLITTCATSRPDRRSAHDPATATKIALRSLARRHQHLRADIADLDELLAPLVHAINPKLLEVNGVGVDVAGQLLVTAGHNSDRLHSEAAFAKLCGVAPMPASSGQTNRHRLSRSGDRQANHALWRIALTRMATDERTRAYVTRRTRDGLSKRETIRCLKRYIARELYPILNPKDHAPTG